MTAAPIDLVHHVLSSAADAAPERLAHLVLINQRLSELVRRTETSPYG